MESSISTDQSLEDSMLEEYWDDFDKNNQIKIPKIGHKFLDLDDPFAAAYQKDNKDFEKLKRNFDPDKPPLLLDYNRLNKKYRMPSKILLETQKNEYRKYINKLRDAAKVLIKRSAASSQIAARNFVKAKFKEYKERAEEETYLWFSQFLTFKEELERKDKLIQELKDNFTTQEMMLTHSSVLLSSAGIDYLELVQKENKIK